MNFKRVTVCLLAALITGCGGAAADPIKAKWVGTWEWTDSSGGIAGDIIEPGEDDPKKTMELTGDQLIILRTDGDETDRKKFQIVTVKSIFSGKDASAITVEGTSMARVIQLSDDGQTLSLSDNVTDGFSDSYKRTKHD